MNIRLVKRSGSAIDIVNAARVSFGKEIYQMQDKDWKLIKYLWTNQHTSPFRHISFTFHIRAPIFVLRQWMKHQVGCSWNEISGRYVEFEYGFFSPDKWRSKPDKSIKQGSGDNLDSSTQADATMIYQNAVDHLFDTYKHLIKMGVCKEQARMILPTSLISECYWTCSFQALIHFLKQRTDTHAQKEIAAYAWDIVAMLCENEEMKRLMRICGFIA
tara:strand:- start:3668 stop:4315 length:648 start_codon:yes stop_codon:yes gene_type:complete